MPRGGTRTRAGLSERFLSDVDRMIARIRERPYAFVAVSGDVRRALLHTFPYAVYFGTSDEAVVVLAVLHLRRNPKVWRGLAPCVFLIHCSEL